jgi:hypothetical protein
METFRGGRVLVSSHPTPVISTPPKLEDEIVAGFVSDYVNNKAIDHIFVASARRPHATLYIGPSPSITVKTGEVSEPSDEGVGANNLSNLPSAMGGTNSNRAAVILATPTAN